MNYYLITLLVVSAALVGVGAYVGRLVQNTDDFFVAGRRLGPFLLFSTVLAANIGAGSTVAAAGLGYRDGLSGWWWVGSAGIGTIILAFLVGPRMWAIAREKGLLTVGDFLEHRYGMRMRTLIAVLLWLGTLAILAGQLVALAWVLEVVAGIPKFMGCLIGGVVMITYFTAGGLAGASWVNAIQLVVLLAGFAIALPLAIANSGGVSALMASTSSVASDYMNFTGGGRSGLIYLPLLVPAFVLSPGLIQKVYGARNATVVRVGVGISGLFLLMFSFAPVILGMVARINYPDLANPELALPTLFMRDMPFAVGVLGLSALFVAEVSSADAILFMLATSLSNDLYRTFVNPKADDATLLKVARYAAVGGGTLGVALAIGAPSVAGALTVFYSLLSVSLFVPVFAGLFWSGLGQFEATAAVVGGVLVTATVHMGTEEGRVAGMPPVMIGLITAVAVSVILYYLARNLDRSTG